MDRCMNYHFLNLNKVVIKSKQGLFHFHVTYYLQSQVSDPNYNSLLLEVTLYNVSINQRNVSKFDQLQHLNSQISPVWDHGRLYQSLCQSIKQM